MERRMCIGEMRKMAAEKTPFIYEYSDGDTIPAIVAAFDPEVGFTLLATADQTEQGWQPQIGEGKEWCLVGASVAAYPGEALLELASEYLTRIRDTGRYVVGSARGSTVGTSPTCSFAGGG